MASAGYKPHVVRELVEISPETFRYWRANLDPSPHRSLFTAGDVLGYHVFAVLIRYKHVSPQFLRKLDFSKLFNVVNSSPLEKLETHVIEINGESERWRFMTNGERMDLLNISRLYVPFEPIIERHVSAFTQLGIVEDVTVSDEGVVLQMSQAKTTR